MPLYVQMVSLRKRVSCLEQRTDTAFGCAYVPQESLIGAVLGTGNVWGQSSSEQDRLVAEAERFLSTWWFLGVTDLYPVRSQYSYVST